MLQHQGVQPEHPVMEEDSKANDWQEYISIAKKFVEHP